MRKILFALIFLFSISVASAIYEISYTCQDGLCTEGSRISFSIKLFHYNLSTRYLGITISDQDDNILAINNKVNTDVIPGRNATVPLVGAIPESLSTYELQLKPCFTFQVLDENLEPITDANETCGNVFVPLSVIPLAEISCTSDAECSDDKACKDNICKPVLCGYCQYASEHKCYSYECCSSLACLADQACIDHRCATLNCREYEYLKEHECKELQCASDETFSEHKCVKLECAEDEAASNHTCIKLECKDNEKIENHRCVRLTCRDNEIAGNHECKALDCGFFTRPSKHKCVLNIRSFIRILLAIIIIVAVLGYLYKKRKQY